MTDPIDPETREILLHEYRVTSTRVDNLTSLIWQTLTVFLGLSGVGLGILARTEIVSPDQVLLASVVAVAVTFTLRWWNKAANKWNDYQTAMYRRLQEIENDLPLRTNSIIKQQDDDRKAKGDSTVSIRLMRNQLVLWISVGWNAYVFLRGFMAILDPSTSQWSLMQLLAVVAVMLFSLGLAVILVGAYFRDTITEIIQNEFGKTSP